MRTGKNAKKRAMREIAELSSLPSVWVRAEKDCQRYGASGMELATNMNSVAERMDLFNAIDESKCASGKYRVMALGKTENLQ